MVKRKFVFSSLLTVAVVCVIFFKSRYSSKRVSATNHRLRAKAAPSNQELQFQKASGLNFSADALPLPWKPSGELSSEVTLVTAYFNIGRFRKGTRIHFVHPKHYYDWMRKFALITNPLVVFLESEKDIAYFKSIRSTARTNRTRYIKVHRKALWSFRLQKKVQQIFDQPGYPRHYPNTVRADYSCAMHAKYEMMLLAANANYFRSTHLAWLDIGLFRALRSAKNFAIAPPPGFRNDHVAYNLVNKRVRSLSHKAIVNSNLVWVCGCFFIATFKSMQSHASAYIRHVNRCVAENIISTDQQILYDMYNQKQESIPIQLYRPLEHHNPWFSLGYQCQQYEN